MSGPASIEANPTESLRDYVRSGALRHIALIMDGNRRWAELRRMPGAQGHYAGYKALKNLVEYASLGLELPVMTVYAFSTENWQRSEHEVNFLLKLFHRSLVDEIDELDAKNVQLHFLGNLDVFPEAFQKACRDAEARTAKNTGMRYQVALNYGGRSEITAACRNLAEAVQRGELAPDAITEDMIAKRLYTGTAVDPDIIIRTGGEYRLSNFLLWQAAYSEIYIADELWPEFTPDVLDRAIEVFRQRQRRFGK